MRHVHLCDPQLDGEGGHYRNHDAQLVREFRRRQIPVTLYARRSCRTACEGLVPEPIFSHDIFQEAARDSQVWPIENFHAGNRAFRADLSRLAAARFTPGDLLYFPNLLQNQLFAVAEWLHDFPPLQRPAVAVMLRYLNHAMDYVQARANKDLIALYYRFAARALHTAQPRCVICADTRELAAAYRQILSLPVLELPNPMDVSAQLPAAGSRPITDRPVVLYQGHTSALRGLHFLPEIIERCRGLSARPRFIVQVQNRAAAATGPLAPFLTRLDRLAAAAPDDLQLVEGALPAAEYHTLLQSADVVLLPYSPRFYGVGSSGVFTEAASLGKVVVVPAGTVPARQGREYDLGTVVADQWNPTALAGAVEIALRDLPRLRARAMAGAPRFRSEQSARALVDKLFAAVPPPEPALATEAA